MIIVLDESLILTLIPLTWDGHAVLRNEGNSADFISDAIIIIIII